MIKNNFLKTVTDTKVKEYTNTSSPEWLWELLPLSKKTNKTVINSRRIIEDIINRKDKRKLFIIGSCSVHDPDETVEYSKKLFEIAQEIKNEILIIERMNFEKPRTLSDWPGFLEDPCRDGSNDIEKGRYLSRQLLIKINEMGIPCATEYVNTSTPQYIGDLISLCWVGARTVESQMHKRMASGLSTAVGFKNNLQGSIESAINAVITARSPGKFIGIKPNGKEAIINSFGNPYGFAILRGGKTPNFSSENVKDVQRKMKAKKLQPIVVIDCSHGNSEKDYKKQLAVFRDTIQQMKDNKEIIGLMLESYLKPGKQKIISGRKLSYGVSITDACISLPDTIKLLKFAYKELKRTQK